MKVQIIGYGVVGKAQAHLCKTLNHDVFIYDPKLKKNILNKNSDLIFFCVPEKEIENAIEQAIIFNGLKIIKSTVEVGTTNTLMKKHDMHLCHNPEFLREKTSFIDVINPSRVVIGECCKEHGDILELFYSPLNCKIYRTNPQTSELIKLVSNSLRAMNISFWNELYQLCNKVNADMNIIEEAADSSKVLGEWEGGKWGTKFFDKPYSGKCLPKDIKLLMLVFRNHGLDPALLEASEKINDKYYD
ncbi:UDP-glucose/GDP-mannose dehydrogenase family protein [Candidatus Bathyarchaeota archaeon]|nr:UDP-glucose/GDP-mannose dehydrogenase family protein [Candidatus Bathyarchaeota archaeon]